MLLIGIQKFELYYIYDFIFLKIKIFYSSCIIYLIIFNLQYLLRLINIAIYLLAHLIKSHMAKCHPKP